MKNYCYEIGKLLYEVVDDDVYFASNIESINDLRRVLTGLKGLDAETARKVVSLLDDLERNYQGKALYLQIDDIKRNLAGILALLKKTKGEEVELEEVETT